MTIPLGVVGWLRSEGSIEEASVAVLTDEIERTERKIVNLRADRDASRLRAIELMTAANFLEAAGLKVEKVDGVVTVSIERVLAPETPVT